MIINTMLLRLPGCVGTRLLFFFWHAYNTAVCLGLGQWNGVWNVHNLHGDKALCLVSLTMTITGHSISVTPSESAGASSWVII